MYTSTYEAKIHSSYVRLAFALAILWSVAFGVIGTTYYTIVKSNAQNTALARVETVLEATESLNCETHHNQSAAEMKPLLERFTDYRIHIGRMDSRDPTTMPDAWERKAIMRFQQGEESVHTFYKDNGDGYLRYTKPIYAKVNQGKTKTGDLVGCLSVFVPVDSLLTTARNSFIAVGTGLLFLWSCGMSLCYAIWQRSHTDSQQSSSVITDIRRTALRSQEVSLASSRLLQSLNHRLRTPLQGILANAELINNDRLPGEHLEKAITIKNCSHELADTIGDLSCLLDMECGRLQISDHPTNVKSILRHAVRNVSEIAEAHRVKIEVDNEDGLPENIVTDPRRLIEILTYFLGFSIDRSDGSTVHLKVIGQIVSADLYDWSFIISDSGTTLNEASLRRLFDPPLSDEQNGRFVETGNLRLAISSRLAGHMKAHVCAHHAPGHGIELRLDITCPGIEGHFDLKHADDEAQFLRNHNALLVSSFNDSREIVATILSSRLMSVTTVSTLEQCKELLRKDPSQFDVVLYEPHPGVRGCTQIKQEIHDIVPQENLPIILLCDDYHLTPSVINEFRYTLTKPINDTVLGQLVYEAVSRSNAPHNEEKAELRPMQETATRYPLNILIADDNEVNIKVTTQLLARLGYEGVEAARNGTEAVDLACTGQFDLVLMDLDMPEMTGWQATSHIHAALKPEQMPQIVAITAAEKEHCQEVAVTRGMDDFINKPIDMHDLMRIAENAYLRTQRRNAQKLTA